jgi:multisubunit Na+/H+ antiporter MnhB subunit
MLKADSFLFRIGFYGVFLFSQVIALVLLLRGHNLPGGGFIGGLVCALSLVGLSFVHGVPFVQKVLIWDPLQWAAIGLILAALSAAAGPLVGGFFLEHFNTYVDLPILGKTALGTPLVFDSGVFLVVIGVFTKGVFGLASFGQEES